MLENTTRERNRQTRIDITCRNHQLSTHNLFSFVNSILLVRDQLEIESGCLSVISFGISFVRVFRIGLETCLLIAARGFYFFFALHTPFTTEPSAARSIHLVFGGAVFVGGGWESAAYSFLYLWFWFGMVRVSSRGGK